jgi:hypothetical protein
MDENSVLCISKYYTIHASAQASFPSGHFLLVKKNRNKSEMLIHTAAIYKTTDV